MKKKINVIYAPDYETDVVGPLVFLFGPIEDAESWHSQIMKLFQKYCPPEISEMTIAIPKHLSLIKGKYSEDEKKKHIKWVNWCLDYTHELGVSAAYLVKPTKKTIGMDGVITSYMEIGRLIEQNRLRESKVVIGVENKHPNSPEISALVESQSGILVPNTLDSFVQEIFRILMDPNESYRSRVREHLARLKAHAPLEVPSMID